MAVANVPAGLLGKYYAARHAHGHYLSCAVTGSYVLSSKTQERFEDLLEFSLARTIDRHPVLCYGLVGSTPGSEAHFFQVPAIHFDDVVEVHNARPEDGDDDTALSKHIGIGHQHLFVDQTKRPAWKLLVLKHGKLTEDQIQRIDIIFVSHHAIADGTSGTAFHRTLLENLHLVLSSSLPNIGVESPYIVPSSIPKPVYVEGSFPVLQSSPTEPLSNTTEPPPTNTTPTQVAQPDTFTSPFLKSTSDFKSRVTFITIPASSLPGNSTLSAA